MDSKSRYEYLNRLRFDKIAFRENLLNSESTMYFKEYLIRFFDGFSLEREGPGRDKSGPSMATIKKDMAFRWLDNYAPEKVNRVKSNLEQIEKLGIHKIMRELRSNFNKERGIK